MPEKVQPIQELLKASETLEEFGTLYAQEAARTAIFIGAGLSVGPGLYGTWNELVNRLEPLLKKPLKAGASAVEFAEQAARDNPYRYQIEVLKPFVEPRTIVQKALSRMLELQAGLYVTTNYDPSLIDQLHQRPPVSMLPDRLTPRAYALPDLPDPSAVAPGSAVHVHGFIPIGATALPDIILRKSEFERHYSKGTAKTPTVGVAREFTHRLVSNFHVLFVGFSFGDDYIPEVLREVFLQRQRAATQGAPMTRWYALMAVPLYWFDGKHLSPYVDTAAFLVLRARLLEFGVTPIWYDGATDHEQLATILRNWADKRSNAEQDASGSGFIPKERR